MSKAIAEKMEFAAYEPVVVQVEPVGDGGDRHHGE